MNKIWLKMQHTVSRNFFMMWVTWQRLCCESLAFANPVSFSDISGHFYTPPFIGSTQLIARFLDILLVGKMNRMIAMWQLLHPKRIVSLFSIFDRNAKLFSSNFLTQDFQTKMCIPPYMQESVAYSSGGGLLVTDVQRGVDISPCFLFILPLAVTFFVLWAFLMSKSGDFIWISMDGNWEKWVRFIRSGARVRQCFWYQGIN